MSDLQNQILVVILMAAGSAVTTCTMYRDAMYEGTMKASYFQNRDSKEFIGDLL